jgi:hypothetical protein
MSDQETVERLRAQGVEAETVGNIMGDETSAAGSPTARFVPPVLEGVPQLPAPGIYFGMSDEDYHALPALSASGIKKLAASPMIFWSDTAWLCERKRREVEEAKEGGDKAHFIFGKAYHCRIMEGREAFASRFAVELDPADYPDALVSSEQIKAAIARHTQMQPVKPQGGKEALVRQLLLLAGEPVFTDDMKEFLDGEKVTVDALKTRIGLFEEEAQVKPVSKVPDTMPDTGEEYMRAAVKADWIAQLLELDPEAQIFDVIAEQHRAAHPGKVFLTPDQHAELEIAALMVERDPEIQHAFKGGHAEVTLIWYCPRTGVPMKARVDYLKIKALVDLKTVANMRQRSIEQAIRFEIAAYHYNIQPAVYFEGAQVVRRLILQDKAVIDGTPEQVAWAKKWAIHRNPDEWLWVFQQKGNAPITRGVWFPRGTVKMVSDEIVMAAKKRFRQFAETFGTDPWLDVRPTYTIADEEIPLGATEI